MKILYINTLYSPFIEGGAEISLQLIVEGLHSKGYEVAVLSLMPGKGLKEEIVNGVKVYRAGLKNRYWPYTRQRPGKVQRLAWHLKDRFNRDMGAYVKEVLQLEKPDVVSCHNLAGWSIAAWDTIYQAGVPIIQVLHDMYLACANSNMFKDDQPCDQQCLSCRLLRSRHPAKSSQVSAVVGISQSILSRFTELGYFHKAEKRVIHNTRHIPTPPTKRSRNAGDTLRVGYLGTLSRIKGVEWLIEQFKSLDIDATLSIGGKGQADYEAHLQSISTKPSISFLGQVNAHDFYSEVDVLVVPSLWQEPLGMVAIEALAHHLPVIAHNTGGLQESVIENVNGLFCYASDPKSLAAAITKLYKDVELYNRLSAAARDSVKSILSKERMIGEYEAVIDLFPTQSSNPKHVNEG
jgi:glycosyltransferase involved in cell wall biosynthesis